MLEALTSSLATAFASLAGLGVLAAIGGGFVWALWAASRNAELRKRRWAELAAKYGLQYDPGGWFKTPSIDGAIDGFGIHVETFSTGGKNSRAYTRVSIRPPVRLPRGLTLRGENMLSGIGKLLGKQDIQVGEAGIDDRLMIQGSNPADVQSWLHNPQAQMAATHVAGAYCGVSQGKVQLSKYGMLGDELEDLVDRTLQIARVLHHARVQPWLELNATAGLALVDRGESFRVTGAIDGFDVDVVGDPAEGRARIQVPMPRGLPAKLRIERGRSELGDPILDRTIAATGASTDALRELLSRDGIREDLLTVVHAHPGSVVDAERIVIDVAGFSDADLPRYVHDAVTLARRFEERIRALEEARRRQRGAPKTLT